MAEKVKRLKSFNGWTITKQKHLGHWAYTAHKKGVYHYSNSLVILKNRCRGTDRQYIKGW